MATFMRFEGIHGFNVDLVAEWHYSEPAPVEAVGPAESVEEGSAPVSAPELLLTYSDGHQSTVTGEAALALHRYFRTVGSALT